MKHLGKLVPISGACCCLLSPDCPSASIRSSLEITLTWEGDAELGLRVEEPGGKVVSDTERLGVSEKL